VNQGRRGTPAAPCERSVGEPEGSSDSEEGTTMTADDRCDPEVVLHVACGIMDGESYPEIAADFQEAGAVITRKEAEIATCYAIRFLAVTVAWSPPEVADFCDLAEVQLDREDVLKLAASFQARELRSDT